MWEARRLTTVWAFTACYGDGFTLPLTFILLWNEDAKVNNVSLFSLHLGALGIYPRVNNTIGANKTSAFKLRKEGLV
jgi:hypothetical protein